MLKRDPMPYLPRPQNDNGQYRTRVGESCIPQSSFRTDTGLLFFAEFLIQFEPHSCAVLDDLRCPLYALHVQLRLMRRHIKLRSVGRFHQHLLQPRNREDVFDMVVVEHEHQLRRKRPHAVVHHHRVVQVEQHAVVDVVERMVEVDRGLCRELRCQPHVVPLRKRILRLF